MASSQCAEMEGAAALPEETEEAGGTTTEDECLEPSEKEIEMSMHQLKKWKSMDLASLAKPAEHSAIYKVVNEAWKMLAEIYRQRYPLVKPYTREIFECAALTLKKIRDMIRRKAKEPRKKEDIDHIQVLISLLGCVGAGLAAFTKDYETNGFDREFHKQFGGAWWIIMMDMLELILKVDSNIGCAMLDVIASIGNDIFCQMAETDHKRLIVFLLGYATDKELSAQFRAKIGRCLAKLIEFPSLRDDLSFFMDLFGITVRSFVAGESAVKTSYAWAFGNITDAMVEAHMATTLGDQPSFVRILLHTATICFDVPVRGRYSACRACGNIYRWMKEDMLEDMENKMMIMQITAQLTSMVGNGMDYKLRWNAAHALGHALENDIFFSEMNAEVTDPIVKVLAKWSAQSQNYKERTQCVISLLKAKERAMYGASYPYVWDRICLSLSRLPVEDCDSVEKFKIEALLMILHLVSLLKQEDLGVVDAIIVKYGELINLVVSEVSQEIPPERLDEALVCKENLTTLRGCTKNGREDECVKNLITIFKPVCGD